MAKNPEHLITLDLIYRLIKARDPNPISIDEIRNELNLQHPRSQTIEFINRLVYEDKFIKDNPHDPILGSYVINPANIDTEGYVKRFKNDSWVKRINKGAAIAAVIGTILTLVFGLMAVRDSSQVKNMQAQLKEKTSEADLLTLLNKAKTDSIILLKDQLKAKDTIKPKPIQSQSLK